MLASVENNFAALLLQHCEGMADKKAISIPLEWDDEKVLRYDELSYGEVASRVSAYQQGMQKAGFVSGDRIVLMYPPNADMFCLVSAMMASAIVPIFIDTGMGRKKILMAMQDSKANAVISVKKLLNLKPVLKALWGKQLIKVDDGGLVQLFIENDLSPSIAPCETEQTCLITFTSGSTGRPKGADRTHYSLIQQHLALQEHLPFVPEDVVLTCFPVSVLHGLSCGITSILPAIDMSSPGNYQAAPVVSQIKELNVTSLSGAPAFMAHLMNYLDSIGESLPLVRGGGVGGAAVSPGLCESIIKVMGERPFHVIYGSTESEPISSVEASIFLKELKSTQGLLVGRPCAAVEVKVVSFPHAVVQLSESRVESCECPSGVIGEIIVKGPHVLKGYIDNPIANKENKIPCADGQVWHRTGDTGFFDSQGRIVLVGREKDKIQFKGQTLHPYLIEPNADSLPELSRSALLNVNGQAQLVYVLAIGADQAQAEQALQALLAAQGWDSLPLVLIDSIPVDGRHNSKVDRSKLIRQINSPASDSRFIVSLNRVDGLTLSGVVFAFAAILLAIKGHFAFALSSLFVAMLADALDGIWARKRGIERSFGRYLDGFVDELDYLIAPSVFLYLWGFDQFHQVAVLLVFMMCGMVRLSVFNEVGNIKEDKGLSYLGMPVFWSVFLLGAAYLLSFILPQIAIFTLLSLSLAAMSFMMVYQAPFFKFKSLKQILILVGSGMSVFAIIGLLGG